MELLSRSAK